MAKSNGNYGSVLRLNQPVPKIPEDKVHKSIVITHAQAGDVSKKFGNPITRGGHTALSPAIDFSGGPDLYIGKAVRQAIKYGPGGAQFQRKRDSTGKFSSAQDAGQQSTAEEDQINQQRDAKLRQHRIIDRLHGDGNPNKGQSNAKKGMVPGVSDTTTPDSFVNDTSANVIGGTTSGQPIYDDPFHSGHQGFSDQDHNEAANLRSQQAMQSQHAGDLEGAARNQSAAQAHTEQARSSMDPGGRFMDNLFNQQGTPEVQPDDMGQFQDLLGTGQQDPMEGNPAVAGGAIQQDPGTEEPMAPSPIDAMMAQDPMAQDQGGVDGLLGQEGPGPAPGMEHTETGGPVGPQTDVGESSASGGSDDDFMLSGSEIGGDDEFGQDGDEYSDSTAPRQEDDEDLSQAAMKAIAALRRYL